MRRPCLVASSSSTPATNHSRLPARSRTKASAASPEPSTTTDTRLAGCRAWKPAFLPRSVDQPAAAHEEHQQHGIEQKCRARYRPREIEQRKHERYGERRDHHREENQPQVVQARVTPQAAIEAEAPEQACLHRHHRRQRMQQDQPVLVRHIEIEAQPERQRPGQPPRRRGRESSPAPCAG